MAVTLESLELQIEVNQQQLTSGLNKANKKVDEFGNKSEKAFKRAGAAFGAIVSVAAAQQLLGGIASTIIRFEKLEAQLKTVTGSVEKADKAFALIKEFAKTTPFQLDEVVGAFIKLKAFGLDPSEAALISYGNTATATGKSLNQMIEAVADAATFQFERLLEFGIKARTQTDQVTFTFQGVTTTVKKNSKDIIKFLRDIGDVTFATGMSDQAETLGTAASNMSDAIDQLAVAIGEAGLKDLFKDITLAITATTKGVTDNIETIKNLGSVFVNILPGVLFWKGALTLLNDEQEKNNKLVKEATELATPGIIDPTAPRPVEKPEEIVGEAFQREQKILKELQEQADRDAEDAKREHQQILQGIIGDSQNDIAAMTSKWQKGLQVVDDLSGRQKLSATVSTFKDLTGLVSNNNKALFALNKVAAIAQVALNTPESISDAFKWGNKLGGPPVGFAFAAVAGAAQIAQLAAISSTSFGGGGASAGAGGGGASSSTASTQEAPADDRGLNVSIQGFDRDTLFSGNQINELIKALNDELEDGAVLKGISVA